MENVQKIEMVRTCGKNVRRKKYEEGVKNTSEGKRSVRKPRKRWLDDVDGAVKKKMGVRHWGETV